MHVSFGLHYFLNNMVVYNAFKLFIFESFEFLCNYPSFIKKK